MTDRYVKTLESKIDELENKVATHNPTTLNIINMLIEQKKKFIDDKDIKFGWRGMFPYQILHEICTIKICIGRQMGHSTALYEIYKKDTLNTMMVVLNEQCKKLWKGSKTIKELESYGSTITQKLILCDTILCEREHQNNILTAIVKSCVHYGTPPIIVMT